MAAPLSIPDAVKATAQYGDKVSRAYARDKAGMARSFSFSACFVAALAFAYLLITRPPALPPQVVVPANAPILDRYTGADAAKDKEAQAKVNDTNAKSLKELSESVASMRATLDAIDKRTTRIEAKQDSK